MYVFYLDVGMPTTCVSNTHLGQEGVLDPSEL